MRQGSREDEGEFRIRQWDLFWGNTSPQSGMNSPFSGYGFLMALDGIWRLVVQIKAIQNDERNGSNVSLNVIFFTSGSLNSKTESKKGEEEEE